MNKKDTITLTIGAVIGISMNIIAVIYYYC